ncbi:phosphatidylserine/phosphatidylglycerophosphate/ cardiolipin synthase [Rubidibacter lacunae KORDI 51-2]|uniref:phospholipase D n=1 Tax=Rubidibacter lacunae KORDI 51-2 TaxID=582515 RepID=U5DNI0_9CHRO|nr:phospholipase D-like domain-containing protein [Rubidibacter lacunae]ERN42159.1 phosphatidylserine/phosphatidylglycerophosphate/ cardiolipin synthase [Rubidibacter lacunae KORDI 51-2]
MRWQSWFSSGLALGISVTALFALQACNWLGAREALAPLGVNGASNRAGQIGSSQPRLEPLPQAANVRVYFNQNLQIDADYVEPYRQIERPGDNLEQIVVEAIGGAQSSLEVAVQELRLPAIARAIAERHRAGVRVRVIIENTYSTPWSSLTAGDLRDADNRDRDAYEEARALIDVNGDGTLDVGEIASGDALVVLGDAGVPTIDDSADGSAGSGLMHHKFIVIDGRTVVTGSANLTTSGIHGDFGEPSSRGNVNHLLAIDSPDLARLFVEEFELMWGDGPGGSTDSRFGLGKPDRRAATVWAGDTKIVVHFSPTSKTLPFEDSSNGLIAHTLATATQSIDLILFVFSEQVLVDVIRDRHERGVAVNALIDRSFAYRSYSEGLDMLGVVIANHNCTIEENNAPWATPIETVGIPNLPAGDKLHHKFALVDDRVVVTGSHNWSPTANRRNDETVLVITDPIVAAHFARERDRLLAGAQFGIPERVKRKQREQRERCSALKVDR